MSREEIFITGKVVDKDFPPGKSAKLTILDSYGKKTIFYAGTGNRAVDIAPITMGAEITVLGHWFQMNGNNFAGLDRWDYTQQQQPAIQPPVQNLAPSPAAQQQQQPHHPKGVAPFVQFEMNPEVRITVSNWVGAAITAGTIKDPNEMKKWAKLAYRALHAASEEFDDDIPFQR